MQIESHNVNNKTLPYITVAVQSCYFQGCTNTWQFSHVGLPRRECDVPFEFEMSCTRFKFSERNVNTGTTRATHILQACPNPLQGLSVSLSPYNLSREKIWPPWVNKLFREVEHRACSAKRIWMQSWLWVGSMAHEVAQCWEVNPWMLWRPY
jgi:hypothetical protein